MDERLVSTESSFFMATIYKEYVVSGLAQSLTKICGYLRAF